MKKLLILLTTLTFLSVGSAYAQSVKLYFKYKVSSKACSSSSFSKLNFSNLRMKITGLDNIKNYSHGSPYLSRISGKIPGFHRTGSLNHTLQMIGQYRIYAYYSPNPGIGFASTANKNMQIVWLSVWSGPGGSVKNLPNATWHASVHILMNGKVCALRFQTK